MARESTLIDFVKENFRYGSLREQFTNFIVAEEGRLPRNDKRCKRQIDKAMELYFRLSDEHYINTGSKKHALITFVSENAGIGSLREQFYNYLIAKRGTFPIDNSKCRTIVLSAIDIYFQKQ